jgi:hypothetical protein
MRRIAGIDGRGRLPGARFVCLLHLNELGTKAWAQAQRSDNPATPGASYLTRAPGGPARLAQPLL